MARGHGGSRPGAGRKKKDLAEVANIAKATTPARIVQAVPEDLLEEFLKTLPPDVTAHGLLKAVIQSPLVPAAVRVHAAAKVLPYEVPKPTTGKENGNGGGITFKLGRHGSASEH